MKIRTDFVTNSSSSSFTVSLIIETKDGKKIWLDYGDDDPEYNSKISVYGNASKMLEATTIGELMERLSIDGPGRIHADDDDEYDEDEDENEDDLPEELKQNVNAVLKTVTIKRYWYATGEWSSTFRYNVDKFMPDLKVLCQKVLNTKGEEKKQAKSELRDYLNNVKDLEIRHGNGTWPDNLCDTDGVNRIDWKQFAGSIEELARKVVDDDLPSGSDRGEEILKLDYAKKTADATNIYYLEW